jgi:poly(3-hydroxyalkanoate) synthetase
MTDTPKKDGDISTSWNDCMSLCSKNFETMMDFSNTFMNAVPNYYKGTYNYNKEFMETFQKVAMNFSKVQSGKEDNSEEEEVSKDYMELLQFNVRLSEKALSSTMSLANDYFGKKLNESWNAWLNTITNNGKEGISEYTDRQAKILNRVVNEYPKAIKEIKKDYGFHFDEPGYEKIAETEHFYLHQVLPNDKGIKADKNKKPIMLIPPYVLGANILAFLPKERKSLAHAYANKGFPTYIRTVKDIATTPAVQVMTPEDDLDGIKYFLKKIKERNSKKATLLGVCQGGYFALIAALSGEIDNLIDALVTFVAPIDGTKSEGFNDYLNGVPDEFHGLEYAVKKLPDGNDVIDGKIISWIFKIKSIEKESPLITFYKDIMMFDKPEIPEIRSTAAAINHWLLYDKTDLPPKIINYSFTAYTDPITKDGTLPVTIRGKKLNFKHITEKNIKFMICIAEKDDLVEKAASTAPADYLDVEITQFPKGHVAMMTSWTNPNSEFPLHGRWGENNEVRGPVRLQMDMDEEADKKVTAVKKTVQADKPKVSLAKKIAPTIKTAPKRNTTAKPAVNRIVKKKEEKK